MTKKLIGLLLFCLSSGFTVHRTYKRQHFVLYNEEDDFLEAPLPGEEQLSREQVQQLTVPQLKQQLRLRGLKVSGNKEDLIKRLLGRENVPEVIDVSAYLDTDEQDLDYKSSISLEPEPEEANPTGEPETWGSQAKIVEDYEGRKVVVDGLSRTIVEITGSNQTALQAFVVASRDALKPFLRGGTNNNTTQTGPEERLREIQMQREKASKRPVRFQDESGIDEGDEVGIFENILQRDFSDWGKYTPTGAQLSAAEVQGVLLLTDVYGPFTDDTQALAEKIAFECQPVVVMVPDLFRGDPWVGPTDAKNENGETYEQWRNKHDELRVSVDIRAAAACLRERYGVSSIAVWGTCFGGGRALEMASGYLPEGNVHDIDGNIGPPLVEPSVAIAWYPTRYNVKELFGSAFNGRNSLAVMAVFAGDDSIPGATPNDAALLKELLDEDVRVKDSMVKVFPGQSHGFAHRGLSVDRESDEVERFVDEEFGGTGKLGIGDGDAEVAALLSTAFMETYSRVFLPTTGPPIRNDETASDWTDSIMMKKLDANGRDIRGEIEESLDNFVEEPLGGYRIDPTDKDSEDELLKLLKRMEEPSQKDGPFAIEDDDDLPTVYAKLKAVDPDFQLF